MEGRERSVISARAQDLAANDALAASTIESLGLNVTGTGLRPQSRPHVRALGWDRTQSRDFQNQAEWCWSLWEKHCDCTGRMPFWMIQFLSCRSMVLHGEYLRQVVMLDPVAHGRRFSLALHCLHPSRLYTPSDRETDPRIRDGIECAAEGTPLAYWIENPGDVQATAGGLSSAEFERIPARMGHWPAMLHGFVQREEEQFRGVSILAPAMKAFRDLSDYLDYELVGAIVAASFPVFIETPFAMEMPGRAIHAQEEEVERFQEVAPGQMLYGTAGQKPHVLEANRPGNSFPAFVERIIRMIGASTGLPYEVVAKDFSRTNYSSARAALLEAWRVYKFYQKWLVDGLCQPCWEMVLEEAWLRGMLELPPGPDFYEAREAITASIWIPPRRGHVDPVKDIQGIAMAREQRMVTLSEAVAELGGDWEEKLEQIAREQEFIEELGLNNAVA